MTIIFLWPMPGKSVFSWIQELIADTVHFIAFMVLTYTLVNFFTACGNVKNLFGRAIIIAVAYGIFIEIMQRGIPGRSSSVSDAAIDTLGALLTVWAIKKDILRVFHLKSGAVACKGV